MLQRLCCAGSRKDQDHWIKKSLDFLIFDQIFFLGSKFRIFHLIYSFALDRIRLKVIQFFWARSWSFWFRWYDLFGPNSMINDVCADPWSGADKFLYFKIILLNLWLKKRLGGAAELKKSNIVEIPRAGFGWSRRRGPMPRWHNLRKSACNVKIIFDNDYKIILIIIL